MKFSPLWRSGIPNPFAILEKQVEPYHPEYAATRVKSALERVEGELRDALLEWFANFLEDLIGTAKIFKDEPLPGFILARLNNRIWWQTWSEKLLQILVGGMLNAGKAGVQTAARQLGIDLSWNYLQPAVIDWAREQAGKLISDILPDIQVGISQIVTAGLSEGKTVYQIRDEIAALKDDREQIVFPEWRAARIARTEVIRAHAQGARAGYLESGVVRGMRWLDGQSGACPVCRSLHNKVVKLGEPFYIDSKFGDGLPPRHPHCRCAVAPVTLDQVKHLPLDHPLRDNRRNSIEELTDIQTYVEIDGIRITGERLRHAQFRHPESTPQMAQKLISLLSQNSITRPGKFNNTRYYVQEAGKWWVVVIAPGENSPFLVTFHRVHRPK